MSSTLHTTKNKISNLTTNTTAGSVLGATVSTSDLVENLITSTTRPTANMIKNIEHTAHALGAGLKNTSKGNLIQSIGNTATLAPRMIGSTGEGIIKTLGASTQSISGVGQAISNSAITLGETTQQSLSTRDASPDISHKEIKLNNPTPLSWDGNHAVLQAKQAPQTKIGRRLRNVKSSVFNLPLNIGRVGTDLIAYTAQRARGVVESLEGVGKDIKSSWSKVFTKNQSFGQKLSNTFTQGVAGSAKSIRHGIKNITKEGVLKPGAAVVGIGANVVGRTLGNTLVPLFNTKKRSEQQDNLFEGKSRYNKLHNYYTSTPRNIQNNDDNNTKFQNDDILQDTEDNTPQKTKKKPLPQDNTSDNNQQKNQ